MSTSDQTILLKLSREQLKQLCKERGHTGYSKCTKPQLVALLGSDTPSKFDPSMMTAALPPKQDTPSSASVSKKRPESGFSGIRESVAKKQRLTNPLPMDTNPSVKSSASSVPSKAKSKPRPAQKLPILRNALLLPASTTPATVPLPTQQLSLPPMSQFLPPPFVDHSLSLAQPPGRSNQLHPTPNSQPYAREAEKRDSGTSFPTTDSSLRLSDGNGHTRPFKKFLDPRNSVLSNNPAPGGPQDTLCSTIVPSSSNVSVESLPAPYLDFPMIPVPIPGLIGMPPSISHRKGVRSWSIILSGISDTERRACVLVSRVFRYAGKSALRLPFRGCLISTLRQSICLLR